MDGGSSGHWPDWRGEGALSVVCRREETSSTLGGNDTPHVRVDADCVGILVTGCATVTIDNPKTVQRSPRCRKTCATAKGTVSFRKRILDNENLSQFNNSNWQFKPRFWLTLRATRFTHLVRCRREHQDSSESRRDDHFYGECVPACHSARRGARFILSMDSAAAAATDVTSTAGKQRRHALNSQGKKPLAPASNDYFYERPDQQPGSGGPRRIGQRRSRNVGSLAVAPDRALTHIRVPIGVRSGPACESDQWPTAAVSHGQRRRDHHGSEHPAVRLVDHQSDQHLLGLTPHADRRPTYWLVIGPADPATSAWNRDSC